MGPLRAPAPDCYGFSFCALSGTEFYCPCCLRGCDCEYSYRAGGNFGEGGLARLTETDWKRPNVLGHGRSCFVYRYRSLESPRRTEFGHTYSPVQRTGQRRESLDPLFVERLPGLDWLSSRLSSRHTAYLLECVLKRLANPRSDWPKVGVEAAKQLHKGILAKNGLFDFELPVNPSLKWEPRHTGVAGSESRVTYCLAMQPRDVALGAVWSRLYGDTGPEGGGLGERGWAGQLRLQLQRDAFSEEVPVGVEVREHEREVRIDARDMTVSYVALKGLDLVFSLPARWLFGGFDARLVRTDRDGGPGLKLASFKSPKVKLRVKTVHPATQSPEAVTSVRWSPVELAGDLRWLVPEYRFSKPNIGCRSDWGREPCCELPWGWTASDFDRDTSAPDWEEYLRVRFVPR